MYMSDKNTEKKISSNDLAIKRTKIEKIDYDDDLNVVVVTTKKKQVIKKN